MWDGGLERVCLCAGPPVLTLFVYLFCSPDVLTKPVSINELKAKLRTVSLRWQLARKTPPQSQASSVAPAQHTTTINSSVTAASAASGSGPHMVVSPLGAPITAPKQA